MIDPATYAEDFQVKYSVRYIHKVSPRADDVGPTVDLTDKDFSDKKKLGAALRKQKALASGASLRSFRREPGGVVVGFPSLPGISSYWHSIILAPKP